MKLREGAVKVDLFNDLPWDAVPESCHRRSASFPLALGAIGSWGVVISIWLPWYGLPVASSWRFDMSNEVNIVSRRLVVSFMRPGSQSWGLAILGLSLSGVALALCALYLLKRARGLSTASRFYLTVGMSVVSTVLVLVTVLAALARPPYGDGPPLSFDWGAVVGMIAALLSAGGGLWACAICAADRRGAPLEPS